MYTTRISSNDLVCSWERILGTFIFPTEWTKRRLIWLQTFISSLTLMILILSGIFHFPVLILSNRIPGNKSVWNKVIFNQCWPLFFACFSEGITRNNSANHVRTVKSSFLKIEKKMSDDEDEVRENSIEIMLTDYLASSCARSTIRWIHGRKMIIDNQFD